MLAAEQVEELGTLRMEHRVVVVNIYDDGVHRRGVADADRNSGQVSLASDVHSDGAVKRRVGEALLVVTENLETVHRDSRALPVRRQLPGVDRSRVPGAAAKQHEKEQRNQAVGYA